MVVHKCESRLTRPPLVSNNSDCQKCKRFVFRQYVQSQRQFVVSSTLRKTRKVDTSGWQIWSGYICACKMPADCIKSHNFRNTSRANTPVPLTVGILLRTGKREGELREEGKKRERTEATRREGHHLRERDCASGELIALLRLKMILRKTHGKRKGHGKRRERNKGKRERHLDPHKIHKKSAPIRNNSQ